MKKREEGARGRTVGEDRKERKGSERERRGREKNNRERERE